MALVGITLLLGAISTVAANAELGNPITGMFLLELLAAGIGGAAVTTVGIIILMRSVRVGGLATVAVRTAAPLIGTGTPDRISWSAWAFLALIVFLVLAYIILVFVASGVNGLILQAVFFVPVFIVVILLARWWSGMSERQNRPPTQ